MIATTSLRRAAAAALASLALTALGGCAMIGPPQERPDRDPEPAGAVDAGPVLADCHVIELDALSAELEEPRERTAGQVRFRYAGSAAVVDAVKAAAPGWVFVISHGWMNGVESGREFTGKLVRGIQERAKKDGVDPAKLAFVAVHWDSERVIFHESAVNAEVIGARRVAPLLARLGDALKQAKVVVVGHSLGGRLMLSALGSEGAPDALLAHGAVLLEAAADHDALLPERASSLIGGFPLAPGRARLVANVHSRQDSVLELAYQNAMQSPAIGREGAVRAAGGERYPTMHLVGPVDPAALDKALADPLAKFPGVAERLFVNVDATSIVSGHSEIFIEPIYDLIWRVAAR